MMMTHFEKVKEFNRFFSLNIPKSPQHDIFEKNPALVKLKMDLIIEEVAELKNAIMEHNFMEVADALGDILYVVYGAAISFGIDIEKVFSLIHESNLSKLCSSQEEAEQTVNWYKKKYAKGETPYDTPNYKYCEDISKFVVFNESSGKILKNVNYHPVDLSFLLEKKDE
ncbi:MAG: hypothetical protein EBZ74_11665 [Planctomycetia bacterium]|nr:hypothetical protein [Planctomycetia bacterium]